MCLGLLLNRLLSEAEATSPYLIAALNRNLFLEIMNQVQHNKLRKRAHFDNWLRSFFNPGC